MGFSTLKMLSPNHGPSLCFRLLLTVTTMMRRTVMRKKPQPHPRNRLPKSEIISSPAAIFGFCTVA